MANPFMATGFGELKVFSGSAHPELTREIAAFLGTTPGQARLRRFPDSEVSFQIDENIRGTDVFVVQPTCSPVDQHIMEMLIMIDAFRRSSAARITAVVPYYGYARQDRKDKPRVPISAKLVANILSAAGTNRVLTMDLHKAQIQGFFDIPVDHLFAAPVIVDFLSSVDQPKFTIGSPAAGGAGRRRVQQDRGAVGCPAARAGHQVDSRRDVGFVVVCLEGVHRAQHERAESKSATETPRHGDSLYISISVSLWPILSVISVSS